MIALSRAQRSLSDTLSNFSFECIGSSQTDDEIIIGLLFALIYIQINYQF
jgi:hypothetical protein